MLFHPMLSLVPSASTLYGKIFWAGTVMFLSNSILELGEMREAKPTSLESRTCQLAQAAIHNETAVRGFWSAVQKCSWPISSDGIACYAGGMAKSPVGRLFSFAVSPVKLTMKTASCITNVDGVMQQIGCIAGLNEESLQALEEKTELVAIFALLFFTWYASIPEEEQKKKRAPLGDIEPV